MDSLNHVYCTRCKAPMVDDPQRPFRGLCDQCAEQAAKEWRDFDAQRSSQAFIQPPPVIVPKRPQYRIPDIASRLKPQGDASRLRRIRKEVIFVWKLGRNQHHCPDCIEYAARSPYLQEELPGVPQDGGTECGEKCHCSLVTGYLSDFPKLATLYKQPKSPSSSLLDAFFAGFSIGLGRKKRRRK